MAKVEIYTTPWCGYCARAKGLLEKKGVAYEEMDVMEDGPKRTEMRTRSKRSTVPFNRVRELLSSFMVLPRPSRTPSTCSTVLSAFRAA